MSWSLGTCPECGSAMRVKAIMGGIIFVECSNPDCDNKWGDQWEVTVNSNE